MYQCDGANCAYSTSSLFSLRRHCRRCRHVQRQEETRDRRTVGDVSVESSSVGMLERDETEEVFDEREIVDLSNFVEECSDERLLEDFGGNDGEEVALVVEIADILSSVASVMGDMTVSSLLRIMHCSHFDLNVFKKHIKSSKDCREIALSGVQGSIVDAGFEKKVVRKTEEEWTGEVTMFKRDIIELLRKQVAYASKEGEMMFRPDEGLKGDRWRNHAMGRAFFKKLYKSIQQEVMRSSDGEVFWIERSEKHPRSFVGFVQVFSDKTATTLKSTGLVAYPVHVVIMNVSQSFRRWLVENGLTLLGFLPVTMKRYENTKGPEQVGERSVVYWFTGTNEVGLEETSRQIGQPILREWKMKLLHEAMVKMLNPLDKCGSTSFEVCGRGSEKWRCFPVVTSYCCDIPEGKDMSCVKHGIVVRRPCVRCMATMSDIRNLRGSQCRTIEDMSCARRQYGRCLEAALLEKRKGNRGKEREFMREAEETLRNVALSPWRSFLEINGFRAGGRDPEMYSLFTFEPLHNLHLGISRMLKECVVSYLSSESIFTNVSDGGGEPKPLVRIRNATLRGCNVLLSAFERESGTPVVRVDFCKGDASSELNGLFVNLGVRGMLEGKDFEAVDMVFPFVAGFIDRATGYVQSAPMTRVHTMYTDIVNRLTKDWNEEEASLRVLLDVERSIQKLKGMMRKTFEGHCETGLYTLKFHLLDHIVEDIEKFGSLEVLSSSPFERYNVHIKSAYRATSRRRRRGLEETVGVIHNRQKGRMASLTRAGCGPSQSVVDKWNRIVRYGPFLVRDGVKTSFGVLERVMKGETVVGIGADVAVEMVKLFQKDTMQTFLSLIREDIAERWGQTVNQEVAMEFVKSGYVLGGFVPKLQDHINEGNFIQEPATYGKRLQRIFGTVEFGAEKVLKNSFVLVSGGGQDGKQLWVAKVLLLFRIYGGRGGGDEEYAFIQYMECTPPLDEIDEALGCVCLRWSTEDEADHTMEGSIGKKKRKLPEIGEWFGVEPFSTIRGRVHVIRSNYGIAPFSSGLHWPEHRFYINRFFREEGQNVSVALQKS